MLQIFFSFLLFVSLFAEEKVSTHSIQIEKESSNYTAVIESGEVSCISYIKEGSNRPITFLFNGGPGSSSVWLHLGALGPRRIIAPEEGQSFTPPYRLIDNAETLLDQTDLVFIDPMGTGFSKGESKENEKKCYSIQGDIASIGTFIRGYLTKNKRWNSPKYIAGESYGSLRAAGLAEYLQIEFGIYLNGLIFISPAIDFQTLVFDTDNPAPYFLFLPSYATTAWYHGRYRPEATLEEVAQEARDFVYKTYAPSLICRKCVDQEPIYESLSHMTALPLDTVRRCRGRIDDAMFFLSLLADQGKRIGRYDSRITGLPAKGELQDPSYTTISGIFSGVFHDYLHNELGLQSSYTLTSDEVNEQWNFWDYNDWGYPNLMSGLRRALIGNPNMKVFVACGYFDLATPFAAAEYCFDHLDIPGASVQIGYYEGGHMFYLNPSARTKFKQDLLRFYEKTP